MRIRFFVLLLFLLILLALQHATAFAANCFCSAGGSGGTTGGATRNRCRSGVGAAGAAGAVVEGVRVSRLQFMIKLILLLITRSVMRPRVILFAMLLARGDHAAAEIIAAAAVRPL